MLPFAPLQLLDDFILNYNVGQVLLLFFVLSLPVGYVIGSRKVTAINLTLFGAIFIVVPSIGGGEIYYMFMGIGLLVLGPLLFATADR